MEYFVDKKSIVRKIWGKGDTILLIFAGAAAEFALNKSVDWLYFTGRLPADPLGRLFSTVTYARKIVFSEEEPALQAIDKIAAIHARVETGRGRKIPDWAYRDVLFMLIDYSIRSYELLEHRLSETEKQEVFDVFYRVGNRMGICGLPQSFKDWQRMRREHLQNDLEYSHYTADLYSRYRIHLGKMRYTVLLEAQSLLVPSRVRQQLGLKKFSLLKPMIRPYRLSRNLKLDLLLKYFLLPARYKNEIKDLDQLPEASGI